MEKNKIKTKKNNIVMEGRQGATVTRQTTIASVTTSSQADIGHNTSCKIRKPLMNSGVYHHYK